MIGRAVRASVAASVFATAVVAQVANGSFECDRREYRPAFRMDGFRHDRHQRHPRDALSHVHDGCGGAVSDRRCEVIRLASSIQATPAAPGAASRVESTFTTGTSGNVLKLDVAFATAETPGDPVYNDFMTVTVTVGTTTATLWSAQTTTGSFPVDNTCNTFPSTGKIALSGLRPVSGLHLHHSGHVARLRRERR
jgi:hypothetical protein